MGREVSVAHAKMEVQLRRRPTKEAPATNLEKVNGGPGVNSGGLVDGSDNGTLGVLSRVEGGGQVKLEALGELVLELDLGSEEVGGVPDLMRKNMPGEDKYRISGRSLTKKKDRVLLVCSVETWASDPCRTWHRGRNRVRDEMQDEAKVDGDDITPYSFLP